jgi:hypothetical protein
MPHFEAAAKFAEVRAQRDPLKFNTKSESILGFVCFVLSTLRRPLLGEHRP